MTYCITHVVQQLSSGGAGRAILYLAKYSGMYGDFRHQVISILPPTAEALELASKNGIQVFSNLSLSDRNNILAQSDVVQLSWWNNPEVQAFIKSELPEIRSIGWFHVGGQSAPNVITEKILGFFDLAAACSPYTLKSKSFSIYRNKYPDKTALIYGATDFARLKEFRKKAHTNFNIGYIGTLDFLKMHPDFASMSLAAKIPNVRFVLCGKGPATESIKTKAYELNRPDAFEFKGYVENIAETLAELDVYGYPLCADTYAASEMNLQEAMYAGIPPVVFPHGGISELVINEVTGLVVNSQSEYTQALERLFQSAELRERLGRQAHEYAKNTFGAEIAGREINRYYQKLLSAPKRKHCWPSAVEFKDPAQLEVHDLFINPLSNSSISSYLDFIGEIKSVFLSSIIANNALNAVQADLEIARSDKNFCNLGLREYLRCHPGEAFLNYWMGLTEVYNSDFISALNHFVQAANSSFPDWRVWWFLNKIAVKLGDPALGTETHKVLNHFIQEYRQNDLNQATYLLEQGFAGRLIN